MASTYQYGDKEYTRQQVIDYGRAHYPKLYWIPRGIGISALAASLLLVVIMLMGAGLIVREAGEEYLDMYFSDPRMVVEIVTTVILAIAGIIAIIASFVKPTDEQCFIHGEKCLKQIAQDRAYFHKSSDDRQDF